jgi:uncharacterized Zn finger protein (UPF0148 family)
MTYNCPKCGSFNVQITTDGIICNDCSQGKSFTITSDDSEITQEDEHNFYKKVHNN